MKNKNSSLLLKTAHLFFLVCFLFAIPSCKEDLGNYEYKEINEITIAGIDSVYTLRDTKHLKIEPIIQYSKDTDPDTANYTYEWFEGMTIGAYGVAPKLLYSGRNIDTVLSRTELGLFAMYYRVTDKRTGVYTLKNFKVAMTNKCYEGWLILSGIDTKSRIDFVDTYRAAYKSYLNILDTMKSDLKLSGMPVAIITSRPNNYGDFVNYVITTTGGYGLDYASMGTYQRFDFTNSIPDLANTDFSSSRFYTPFVTKEYLYVDGNLYFNNNSYNFSAFVNRKDAGTHFRVSPFIASNPDYWIAMAIMYNEQESQFYRYPGNGDISFPFVIEGLDTRGMQLNYMTYSDYNGGEVFAILQKAGKAYLARFSMSGKLSYFGEMTAVSVSEIQQFAISPEFGHVFYAIGSKIYEYDTNLKTAVLMTDLVGEKITFLKFHRFLYESIRADYPVLARQLIVGSYRESEPKTSGKLRLYEVPALNKPLTLKRSFDGFGKIVDVTYKEQL